jgi:hypothetical protein
MENKKLVQTSEMVIGNTTYIITTHFKENARETAEDKLLRIITNRISAEINGQKDAII